MAVLTTRCCAVLQSLPKQGSLGEGLDPAVDIQVQVAQLVTGYQASLQELMTQLLVHWKVCSCSVNKSMQQ